MMSNCRLEGGYCIDPNTAHASADPGEAAEGGAAAPAAGGHGGGRGGRRGPNPLGRRHQPQPPQMGMWDTMNVLNQHCASIDMDMGCWRTGGYCCTPYP